MSWALSTATVTSSPVRPVWAGKKPFRIVLQVLMFLPWIRWIVTLIVMSKMQNVK